TGVYINLSSTNTTFVATDGHRLIRYRRVDIASEDAASIIIPRKALNLLKYTLPSENVPINVEFNNTNVYIKFYNIKMICRLNDERLSDYDNVIAVDNDNDMIINRIERLGSMRRIATYANKSTPEVGLKLIGSEL